MEKEFLKDFTRSDYQRDNFDNFLCHVHFSYSVPSIHIAGTNGKGSTANYLKGIFLAAGYRVGVFSSPFFYRINELMTVNNSSISDEDFLRIFNKHEKDFKKYDLSAFEIETFIALAWFSEMHLDIAIIECGMGGETDATNIFMPILSVITSVELEHTEFLGHSLSEIAMQKAGIIKERVPVVFGTFAEDVNKVLSSVAVENESRIHLMNSYHSSKMTNEGYLFSYGKYKDLIVSSFATYEITDACYAIECCGALANRFSISEEAIRQGLKHSILPCRFEAVSRNPLVILDGAHNPEASAALVKACSSMKHLKKIHVIFACFRDKNIVGILANIGSLGDDLTLTTFPHPRARTEDEFFLFTGDYPFENDCVSLIKRKMEEFPDDVILVTGSLAFTAYVRKALKE